MHVKLGIPRKIAKGAAVAAGLTGLALALIAPRERGPLTSQEWDRLRSVRYAHRGLFDAAEGRPENSRAAFRAAARAGFGVELDVHLMADGRLAVIHDSSLMRVCGKPGTIEQLTLEELEGYRLTGTDERPPLLDEVIADIEAETGPGRTPLPAIVEVKSVPGNAFELTRRVMECLDAHAVPYCVESFDPSVLLWLRMRRPEVIRGQLSERHPLSQADDISLPGPLVPPLEAGAAALVGNVAGRPDFIAYRFEDRANAPMRLLRHAFNPRIAVWTIRDQESLDQAEREGALAIFDSFLPAT